MNLRFTDLRRVWLAVLCGCAFVLLASTPSHAASQKNSTPEQLAPDAVSAKKELIRKQKLHVGPDYVDNVMTGSCFAPNSQWVTLHPPGNGWWVSLDCAKFCSTKSNHWQQSAFYLPITDANSLVLEKSGALTFYNSQGQIIRKLRNADTSGKVWDLQALDDGDLILLRDGVEVWRATTSIGGAGAH